ncbi:MAG: phosphate signaling complex protein PhoU [Myxococcota bacterium]
MASAVVPAIGREVDGLRQLALRMGGLAEDILDKSLRALWQRDAHLASEVVSDDLEIDRIDVEIDAAVLNILALRAPVAADLRQTLAIKSIATDLERIGDLARNIAACAGRLAEREPLVPPVLLRELADGSRRALGRALQAFADLDPELALNVVGGDDPIDDVEARVIRESIGRIQSAPSASRQELDWIFVAKHLERVADHATNIAEEVVLVTRSVNLKHAARLAD